MARSRISQFGILCDHQFNALGTYPMNPMKLIPSLLSLVIVVLVVGLALMYGSWRLYLGTPDDRFMATESFPTRNGCLSRADDLRDSNAKYGYRCLPEWLWID